MGYVYSKILSRDIDFSELAETLSLHELRLVLVCCYVCLTQAIKTCHTYD